MAPTLASDPVSQADTPMTDVNDDTVPSVPVDSADAPMTVCYDLPTQIAICVWAYNSGPGPC